MVVTSCHNVVLYNTILLSIWIWKYSQFFFFFFFSQCISKMYQPKPRNQHTFWLLQVFLRSTHYWIRRLSSDQLWGWAQWARHTGSKSLNNHSLLILALRVVSYSNQSRTHTRLITCKPIYLQLINENLSDWLLLIVWWATMPTVHWWLRGHHWQTFNKSKKGEWWTLKWYDSKLGVPTPECLYNAPVKGVALLYWSTPIEDQKVPNSITRFSIWLQMIHP